METSDDWLRAAQDIMLATLSLAEHHPRSAVSRAYFAAYAAVHAILLHSGEQPPSRGNWSHDGLAEHVRVVLQRLRRNDSSFRGAIQMKKDVSDLRNYRVRADYSPTSTIDAAEAVRRARNVLATTEGILR